MEYKINEKVKYLNNMLCEVDKLYQTILLKKRLSDSEYVVLFSILELGEGCLQKDIANNSYINKKTTNSTIKKLEKNGLTAYYQDERLRICKNPHRSYCKYADECNE